jgi:small conductance mechanosensitive channel
MRVVSNLTKGWSRVNIDVAVDYREDLERVTTVLEEAARKTAASPEVHAYIIEGPSVLGVENISGANVSLRLVARTEPFKDPEVARVLRRELATALRENNVVLGAGEPEAGTVE